MSPVRLRPKVSKYLMLFSFSEKPMVTLPFGYTSVIFIWIGFLSLSANSPFYSLILSMILSNSGLTGQDVNLMLEAMASSSILNSGSNEWKVALKHRVASVWHFCLNTWS